MNNLVEGMNKYCGPAVLSILTGKDTDRCAAVIASVTGKYLVTGVTTQDLVRAAKLLKVDIKKVDVPGISLYAQIVNLASLKKYGTYLAVLPKHFVCIEVAEDGVKFNDNHTKTPINAASSARLGQRVVDLYEAVPIKEPVLQDSHYTIDLTTDSIDHALTTFDINLHLIYDKPEANKVKNIAYFSLEEPVAMELLLKLAEKLKVTI